MPVEITILSGARQGEKLGIDGDRIVVGDQAGSDVYFPANRDLPARGKKAIITGGPDGWRIRNEGTGTWLVNQQLLPAQATSALRSGDIVRLSESGPDFQFSIVTGRPTSGVTPAAATAAPRASEGPQVAVARTDAGPRPMSKPAEPTAPARAGQWLRDRAIRRLVLIGGGVLIVVVAATLFWGFFGKTPSGGATVDSSSSHTTRTGLDKPIPPVDVPKPPGEKPPAEKAPDKPRTEVPPPPKPAAKPKLTTAQIAEKYASAVVWLGAEIEGQKFPLCTAWAIAPNKVVSTGQRIAELKSLHAKGSFVFAYCETGEPKFLKVTQFALHSRFSEVDPVSDASRLHNVGVMTLEQNLPVFCPLQTSQEFSERVTNMEVTLLGFSIPYDGDKYKPYDILDPPRFVSVSGRVVDTKPLPGDDLPLLVLRADVPTGLAGAPVFSDSGRVVAVLYPSSLGLCAVLSDRFEGWR